MNRVFLCCALGDMGIVYLVSNFVFLFTALKFVKKRYAMTMGERCSPQARDTELQLIFNYVFAYSVILASNVS